jgi:type II protein arginine methyltransferase
MWRQTDDRKVWYEWIVEVFVSSPTEDDSVNSPVAAQGKGKGKAQDMMERDANGKRARSTKTRMLRIAASELHSSVREACLM